MINSSCLVISGALVCDLVHNAEDRGYMREAECLLFLVFAFLGVNLFNLQLVKLSLRLVRMVSNEVISVSKESTAVEACPTAEIERG